MTEASEAEPGGTFAVSLYSNGKELDYPGYARVIVELRTDPDGSLHNPETIAFPTVTKACTIDGVRITGCGFDTGIHPLTCALRGEHDITVLFAPGSITHVALD